MRGAGAAALASALAGALVLGSLAACTGEPPSQQPPLGSIPTEDLIYDRRPAGFTLTFPPTWHDHYEADARSGPIAAAQWPFTKDAVEFVYKAIEPDEPRAVLLTILVYDRGRWDAIATEPGPRAGAVVAEQGQSVYVAIVAQGNPFERGSRDARDFEAMRLTTDQVKDAITLR